MAAGRVAPFANRASGVWLYTKKSVAVPWPSKIIIAQLINVAALALLESVIRLLYLYEQESRSIPAFARMLPA